MALSVKRFIHELNCPEPENQILAMYHPTSADVLCNGGGTQTAIFANGATLNAVAEGGENANGADGDVCEQGMDVVFLIDYTSSMANEIDDVKTGVAGLVNTIDTQSNGDYRLGLVIHDEGQNNNSPAYGPSTFYQNLPAAQKINTSSPDQSGYFMFFTAVEKMNAVGNSTSFTNSLNALNQPNGSNGMVLGGTPQSSFPEQSGRALDEIISNDFAGSFRSGVQKLVILITDAEPAESLTYWQNTLTPTLDANNIQLMVNTNLNGVADYAYATSNTAPQGALHEGLNFSNANWVLGLEQSIEDLCAETFTYNCESLAVGWYLENGTQTAQYWNGSSWTQTHTCEYTVTINISESIAGASLDPISPAYQYYGDSDTFEITGAVGTTFTITHTLSPDPGYQGVDITDITAVVVSSDTGSASVTTYTDNGAGSPIADSNLANNEFKITGTIDGDAVHNLSIRGSATLIRYTMEVTVNSDDLTNTGVSPTGTLNLSGSGFSGTNTNVSKSIVGEMGTTHSFAVNFTPNPSDYTYNVTGTDTTYNNSTTETALESFALTQNSISCVDFVMPLGGGSAQFDILGNVSQPSYAFSLTATENIAGLQLSSSSGMGSGPETFTGYTGSTHAFNIFGDVHPDYNDPNLGTPRITGPNAAQVSATENDENTSISGTVVMPSGGGEADVEMVASAVLPKSLGFTVSVTDDFTDTANYQGVTLNGAAGSTVTATIPLSNTVSDTTYTINSISDNSSALTVTNTGTTLNLSLVMPSGGGSATVDVSGSNTVNQYTYTVTFAIPESHPNYKWSGEASSVVFDQVQVTSVAGANTQVLASKDLVADTDCNLTNISVSETSGNTSLAGFTIDSAETADGQTQTTSFRPKVYVTMPVGGGSTSVACSAVSRELNYTYNVVASTDSGSSGVIDHGCSSPNDPLGLSRTDNGNGSYTLTYTGKAGDRFSTLIPVQANNNTDYRAEIVNWTQNPSVWIGLTEGGNYCGTDLDYLSGDFQMPSLDSRTGLSSDSGTLVINDTVTARTHTFVLTSTDSISNVSVALPAATQTFSGAVGSTHNWSSAYGASSGYNFNITSVDKSGSNPGSVSVTDSTGTNIGGQITMPSGGGSATVTAKGNSSLNEYQFVVTFSESVSNAAWRSTGTSTRTRTVTLAPGEDTTITEYLDASSGYQFSSTSVSDNSSALTGATITSGTTARQVSVTVVMPLDATSNQSGTVSVTGSTVQQIKSITVNYAESITGAFISSGSGSGATALTTDTHNGIPGTTGSRTLYLKSADGYQYPSISSITRSNTSIITAASDASGSGAGYDTWSYNYTIPSSNSTVTITVNGTVETECDCTLLTTPIQASANGSNDGKVVAFIDAGCTEEYVWTINGVLPGFRQPLEISSTRYEFTNLAPGTYTIGLTDANGCGASSSATVTRATTQATTQSTTYYYYQVQDCDGFSHYARATYSTPRFTYHEPGLIPPGFPVGPVLVTQAYGTMPVDYNMTLFTPSFDNCDTAGAGES